MRRHTHNRFARMITGHNVKVKDIDKINGVIDKPTKFDKEFQDMFGVTNQDYFGITGKAKHREYGHNIFGMANAMSMNPEYGAEIFISHQLLDKMSNIIRDSLGTDNRDFAEILFNRMLKSMNETQKVATTTTGFKRRKNIPNFEKKLKKNKFYRMNH